MTDHLRSHTTISVVIATCNRRPLLEGCLSTLAAQKVCTGEYELVVVNDGSTDETAAFLDAFALTASFPVKILHQANTGVGSARNRGIALASGDIIAFTDDDCLLPIDWIASIIRAWQGASDDLAGIGGPLDTECDSNSLVADYIRHLDEFNHLPVITSLLVRPRHISSCTGTERIAYLRTSNASFRASAIRQIGGFDETFRRPGGEDPDLSYRLLASGYRLACLSDLRVKHRSRPDFKAYFGSLSNYVRGEFINRRNRFSYPDGPIRRSYRMIPLQKLASLAITILAAPWQAVAVSHSRKRFDSAAIIFPVLFIVSKLWALWIALVMQLRQPLRTLKKA